MKKVSRSLHLVGATGATRTETFKGRSYLVVPVVALVEGVIWPINAETPEYVTPDSYSIAPEGWNGRPIFSGHPVRGGDQVLGNTPEILEAEQFGIIFNAAVVKSKLTMEAWLNEDDAKAVGPEAEDTYARAKDGGEVEISVGAIVLMEESTGTYEGTDYDGKWVEVFPDHLALLPAGDIGACSIEMGCGIRTATVHRMAAKGYALVSKNAKEEGVPEPKEGDKKPIRTLKHLTGLLRVLAPKGMSDSEVRVELLEALYEKEPKLKYSGWVVDVFENEGLVVYSLYNDDYDCLLYVRDFVWVDDDALIGDLYALVNAKTVYEVEDDVNKENEVLITQLRAACGLPPRAEPKAASGGCGCGKSATTTQPISATQGDDMKTREERIAAMIAASGGKYTEADKTWLTAMPESHFTALESKKEPETLPAVVTETVPETETEFLARNPHLKKIVDRAAAADKSRRLFLVGKLKTAQTEYKEEELNAMPLEELERTARMLGAASANVVDFSAGPVPEGQTEVDNAAPAPPSLNEAVRTARASGSK